MRQPQQVKTAKKSDDKVGDILGMDKAETAYLAGLLDGEGCIRVASGKRKTGRPYHWLEVILTNTHIPTLLEMQEKWGGHLRMHYRDDVKPLGHLRWRSGKAAELLKVLQPYLRIKSEQCRVAMAFLTLLRPRFHPAKRLSLEELMARDELVGEMSILNGSFPNKGDEDP